ncbi:MAG: hypothetical protein NTX92_01710 [Euryarchaeota archaeon]|nr:hypothetical protein [Euryarchaeota archaeon]
MLKMLFPVGIHCFHSRSTECASPHRRPSGLYPMFLYFSWTTTSMFGSWAFVEIAVLSPPGPAPIISTLIGYTNLT